VVVAWREGGRTLIVVDDIAEVVAAAVVSFAHAHGVVGEVDIAVVACVSRGLACTFACKCILYIARASHDLQKSDGESVSVSLSSEWSVTYISASWDSLVECLSRSGVYSLPQ
jgi:hypothetical protein